MSQPPSSADRAWWLTAQPADPPRDQTKIPVGRLVSWGPSRRSTNQFPKTNPPKQTSTNADSAETSWHKVVERPQARPRRRFRWAPWVITVILIFNLVVYVWLARAMMARSG